MNTNHWARRELLANVLRVRCVSVANYYAPGGPADHNSRRSAGTDTGTRRTVPRMREAKPLLGNGFASRIASASRSRGSYGAVTPDSSTGPSVGLSSVSWETPGGVIVSITYGTLAGLYEQIGAVLPDAQTPNV